MCTQDPHWNQTECINTPPEVVIPRLVFQPEYSCVIKTFPDDVFMVPRINEI